MKSSSGLVHTLVFFLVGMRLWAEERRVGTLELLLTMPITPWQAIFGKFLASPGKHADGLLSHRGPAFQGQTDIVAARKTRRVRNRKHGFLQIAEDF